MRKAYAAARQLLQQAANGLGYDARTVPLRLDRKQGVLLSALPRKLAASRGQGEEMLANMLAASVDIDGSPFSSLEGVGSMLVLTLSDGWCQGVLDGYSEIPVLPAQRSGVRQQDEGDPAFLMDYTARRCRELACRGMPTTHYPRELICLLAEENTDPLEICRAYWSLSPRERRQSALARGVGLRAARGLSGR